MNRRSAVWGILSLIPVAARITQPRTELPQNGAWSVSARYTDTCSCQPTCPCFFGSAPTLGYCEGVTLIEIESGHYRDVRLDGVTVLAAYRGGDWMKFYVTDEADEAQTEAAIKLLPTFEEFFVSDNVLEVANVPITVERGAERIRISTPNTTPRSILSNG